MTQLIIPTLVLIIAVFASYKIIISGEMAGSLAEFWTWSKSWAWPQLRRLRHVRKLINWPFRKTLFRSTCMMPFAFGHVWIATDGSGTKIHIIGKLSNGDFILQISDTVLGYAPTNKLRDLIFKHDMYLYEMETHQGLIPTIHSIGGVAGVLWRPVI